MPSIIAMAVWRNLGFAMIVFLAGLQTIPASLYEAASIDGAGRWQTFRFVTHPDAPADDPVHDGHHHDRLPPAVRGAVRHDRTAARSTATLSVTMYMYQQGFAFFHQGYASAIAYVLFVIVAFVAFLQFRFLRSDA